MKKENEKAGLKLSIQKAKITAYSPTTSWQIDGERMETVTEFIFVGSKIISHSDCRHEIKRHLLFEWKVMKNPDRILKSGDHFADKGPYSQSYGFSSSQLWMC